MTRDERKAAETRAIAKALLSFDNDEARAFLASDPNDQAARDLFEQNARGWNSRLQWADLAEDSKQFWRDAAKRRATPEGRNES